MANCARRMIWLLGGAALAVEPSLLREFRPDAAPVAVRVEQAASSEKRAPAERPPTLAAPFLLLRSPRALAGIVNGRRLVGSSR